jgi:dTDP-4-dehydrorhamnose reductase
MTVHTSENELELWGGIECTINRVNDQFFDQLHYSGHYHRPTDIEVLAATGIKRIRYPLLWEKHQPVQKQPIDWQYSAERLQRLKAVNVDVIAGLVHHGSGPLFTNLLDPNFPELLAAYAGQVAAQFPWICYYTPVNEPLTTARFSGLYGFWYPHKRDDHSLLRMLLNQLRGTVLSMNAIRQINPAAKLVQTEDLGKTYSTELLQYQADFENHRRWLTYDLLCGLVTPDHPLWPYLIENGITAKELQFFRQHPCPPDIFGFNHYLTSERYLDENLERYARHTHGGNGRHCYADVEAVRVELEEKSGAKTLLNEAWERYKKPMAVTEVHLHCHREDQLRWFKHMWQVCSALQAEGVEMKALTAWAMLGSYGWNKLLTAPRGDYEPGVFDVRSGTPRPTALARFITQHQAPSTLSLLAHDKGWWCRPDRFFHRPLALNNIEDYTPECSAPVLIIGKTGTLGRAFGRCCRSRALAYHLVSRTECDITNEQAIKRLIAKYRPWAIINAAGYVRVDEAEHEPDECFAANTAGAETLAKLAARHNIRFVTFSTDLVFDGLKNSPYVEEDEASALNVYGSSKAAAEKAVLAANPSALVIRTSAFFSPWDKFNFAVTVRESLLKGDMINVANDVVISPTYVPDLVHATLDLLIDEERGIWHLANGGERTWADFAYEIADRFGLNRSFINPVPVQELAYTARRPVYSALASSRGILLPSLEDALRRFTHEMNANMERETTLVEAERA